MSLAKANPGQLDPTPKRQRHAWEEEETLVDRRRRRLDYRLRWFIANNKWMLIISIFFLFAIFDADVMRAFLAIGEVVLQLLAIISFIVMQFVFFFFFASRSRMYTIWPGQEGVGFKDYRGQPEILDQARQVVKLLRGVKAFEDAGGEPLNGLLFEGPPGTGKTWLAQAISTEAGVPFFFIDASSLSSMFIGVAPMKVGGVYRKARRAARDYGAAVIFIDEIDAVGARPGVAQVEERFESNSLKRNRLPIMMGMGAGGGLLSVLLIELSGFSLEHGWLARKRTWFYRTILRRNPPKPQKRVLTIGATNRIQALDPALLRPGRFDKKIRIDAPDLEGRRDIIAYYLSKMSHDESIDPLIMASETPNYTPADLKYLLNEALRYALFDGRTFMTSRDVRLAQPEHEMGLRTPIKNLAKEDKRRLAAHEAGHAVAIRIFRPHYRISRITIVRQGGALGHVWSYPAFEEYMALDTMEQLYNALRVSVAGRAGEMEFCGVEDQTLGVGGDFAKVRAILSRMADAGMFGALSASAGGANDSMETSRALRDAMEETFQTALSEVRMMMRLHREMGLHLIDLLVEKDELLADEAEQFFDGYGFFTPKVHLEPDEPQPTTTVIAMPKSGSGADEQAKGQAQ